MITYIQNMGKKNKIMLHNILHIKAEGIYIDVATDVEVERSYQ